MSNLSAFVDSILATLSNGFVLLVGLLLITAIILYFIDVFQTKHTIRRNYPLLGRFRYLFERLGEFFRQYFFAMAPRRNAL